MNANPYNITIRSVKPAAHPQIIEGRPPPHVIDDLPNWVNPPGSPRPLPDVPYWVVPGSHLQSKTHSVSITDGQRVFELGPYVGYVTSRNAIRRVKAAV